MVNSKLSEFLFMPLFFLCLLLWPPHRFGILTHKYLDSQFDHHSFTLSLFVPMTPPSLANQNATTIHLRPLLQQKNKPRCYTVLSNFATGSRPPVNTTSSPPPPLSPNQLLHNYIAASADIGSSGCIHRSTTTNSNYPIHH